MSFFKKAIGVVGGLFGGGKNPSANFQTLNTPMQAMGGNFGQSILHNSIMKNQSIMNNTGFNSGIGTTENPIAIDEVVIGGKKVGSTSNWLDKVISGVGSATGLITSIGNLKNGTSNVAQDAGKEVNTLLNNATEDWSVKTGLDKSTKVFLGVLIGGGLLLYFNKR